MNKTGAPNNAIRSEQEVADMLGIARQNVNATENRTMKKLRELFAGECLEDYEHSYVSRSGRWNGRRIVRVRM